MFYLLKSTNDREKCGDVIVNKNEIESIGISKNISKDETYFQVRVCMKSKDYWIANFNNEEEGRQELRSLGVPEEIVNEYMIMTNDIEKNKEDRFKKMMDKMLS